MANTGYKSYSTLLKVTDDGTHRALDVNNVLCSESGLPQASKANINTDPDYVAPVIDHTMCPLPVGTLTITSSIPTVGGTGTLDFTGGVAGETINLSFVVTPNASDPLFDSLEFDEPVTLVGPLDATHLSRSGTVLLDGSGNGHSTYTWSPPTADGSSCIVTITGRSTANPIPTPNNTHINY
jgi:hypothetical protein